MTSWEQRKIINDSLKQYLGFTKPKWTLDITKPFDKTYIKQTYLKSSDE